MRKIRDTANTVVNSDYPDGGLRDKATGVTGTPLVEAIHNDFLQFFLKIARIVGITPNGLADNETNGFQTITVLTAWIRTLAASTSNARR